MNKIVIAICNIMLWSCAASATDTTPWTWHFRKIMSEQQRASAVQKQELLFRYETKQEFTQLLYCWNAQRPIKEGYFSFWVQVRDAATKQWSKWHRMSEWGAQIQKSYLTNKDAISKFVHVRLEMQSHHKADAFAIKIKSHEGASLSLIHALSACVSDMTKFKSEVDCLTLASIPSVSVSGVPTFSQFELNHPRNDGLCSPTSCSILVTYLLQSPIDPIDFAEKSLDTGLDKYGSWPFNMAHAFERCNGKIFFSTARFNSFTDLVDYLRGGIPAVVSVRGPLPNACGAYANGHLMVVVGYDNANQEVICHDPAAPSTDQTVRRYKVSDFMRAWERSHRLVYCAELGDETRG